MKKKIGKALKFVLSLVLVICLGNIYRDLFLGKVPDIYQELATGFGLGFVLPTILLEGKRGKQRKTFVLCTVLFLVADFAWNLYMNSGKDFRLGLVPTLLLGWGLRTFLARMKARRIMARKEADGPEDLEESEGEQL